MLTLMLVEKSLRSQNALKKFFESLGVRVLVTANPNRAISSALSLDANLDCLVFSAIELGSDSIDAFNSLSEQSGLEDMPALIILTKKQTNIVSHVRCDDSRKIVFVPIDIPEVVAILNVILRKSKVSLDSQLHQNFKHNDDFDDDMPLPD